MINKPTPSGQLVPAFESSLGLGDQDAPVMVDKAVLDHFNKELATNGRATLANHVEAANIAALFAKRAIRPDEIAALRREMFRVVTKGLGEVEKVLDGKKSWTASQVRLFSVLTERVMPKLSTISVEDPSKKKLEDLTIDELEALALGKRNHQAIDVVVKEGDRLDRVADRTERRNANIEIKKGLAHVVSLDDAEKRYIARKATRYSLREEERRTLKVLAKPQMKHTDSQLANLRVMREGGLKEAWRRKGHTPEEIEELERQRREKISKRHKHVAQATVIRNALTLNLGDAHGVPDDIAKGKQKILKDFRVHNRKGVRSQTAILKEQQKRQAQEERAKERRENPRVFINNLPGIPKEVQERGLRLRDLRKHRPDLFKEDDDE